VIQIPVAMPELGKEELDNVVEAVKSGWVSSRGPFVDEFERRFSSTMGVRHGVAVSNGTAALHLALAALGIGRDCDVLVPSLTFVATANAVTYTGAKVVFVDSHPGYWCIDPEAIEKSITERTKAILLVHLYGHPCDMDPIMETARLHGLYVIEDCAEAHGAEYKGKKVGSFGDVSCFSFYGNKIMTTGEGGMCLTNDDELADKMEILKNQGMNPKRKYWHDLIGFNYRMTNPQAALGLAQLEKLDRLVNKKRAIAKIYHELLNGCEGVLQGSPEMPWAKNVYWLSSMLLERSKRDEVINCLNYEGIETRPFFYPIHRLPPYREDISLPVAERLSASGLNLPSGPKIEESEVRHVALALQKALLRT